MAPERHPFLLTKDHLMNKRHGLLGAASIALVLAPLGASVPAQAASVPAPSALSVAADQKPDFTFTTFQLRELDGETARVLVRGDGPRGQGLTVTNLESGERVTVSIASASTYVDVPVRRGAVSRLVAMVGEGAGAAVSGELEVDNTADHLDAPVISSITPVGRNSFTLEAETRPGAELIVRDARGREIGHSFITAGEGPARVGATWNTQDAPSERRFTLVQRYGVTSGSTPFLVNTGASTVSPIETPTLENALAEEGRVRIRVATSNAPADSMIVVRDFFGHEVASAPLRGSRGEVVFPAATAKATYLVSVRGMISGAIAESRGVNVLVGAGALVPATPQVMSVRSGVSSAVVTLVGTPGALILVRDDADRLVAVKRIASAATDTQIVVPKVTGLVVTQSTGAIESDPAPIDLP